MKNNFVFLIETDFYFAQSVADILASHHIIFVKKEKLGSLTARRGIGGERISFYIPAEFYDEAKIVIANFIHK